MIDGQHLARERVADFAVVVEKPGAIGSVVVRISRFSVFGDNFPIYPIDEFGRRFGSETDHGLDADRFCIEAIVDHAGGIVHFDVVSDKEEVAAAA